MTDPATDTWAKQLEQLKTRYKHVRPPVLVALNILLHDKDITLDDAKKRAQVHGSRITAASVNAAKTLLLRMDDALAPAANPTPAPASAPTRATRRPRAADTTFDAEALVRGVVAKIQGQSSVEAERLREAIRKAVATLQAAVGAG